MPAVEVLKALSLSSSDLIASRAFILVMTGTKGNDDRVRLSFIRFSSSPCCATASCKAHWCAKRPRRGLVATSLISAEEKVLYKAHMVCCMTETVELASTI